MSTTPKPNAAPASHRIRADLARLAEEQEGAEAEIARLAAGRADVLRSGTDAQLERHDGEAAKHRRTVERTAARVEVLTADLAAAERDEDQAERRSAYDAAIAASAEGERILREVYGPAAEMIRQALERVAELGAVVVAANDRLPAGAALIPDVEEFRQAPHTPPRRYEVEETRYFDREGQQVNPMHHRKPDGSFSPHITPRKVLVPVFEPGSVNVRRDALGRAVNLPSLDAAEPDFWRP